MAAFGGKADVPETDFKSPRLNVCFHLKRTLNQVDLDESDGSLSATSGRGKFSLSVNANSNAELTNGFTIRKPESERVCVSQVLAKQLREGFVGGCSHSVVLILQRLVQKAHGRFPTDVPQSLDGLRPERGVRVL